MYLKYLQNLLKHILEACLTILFPISHDREEVLSHTPETFYHTASKIHHDSKNYISQNTNLLSVFSYRDKLVRQAIWELKYHGTPSVAALFAKILYDEIVEYLSEEYYFSALSQPLLIPIPLSREREKERGWNQTAMLAQELEKLDKNKLFIVQTDILHKTVHTLPQTKLNKKARLKNLQGCFSISSHAFDSGILKNKDIILIDDVTTTGSTILEAMKTLKNAGTRHIRAFTIAH